MMQSSSKYSSRVSLSLLTAGTPCFFLMRLTYICGARSSDHVHNSLVSVFLRKLEYYQGIMFLTTNRVTDFDEAMQSRIHLTLKYGALGIDTRRGIWKSFLETATTIKGKAIYTLNELDKLVRKELNGQEVSFMQAP
jgi:hypothetical protein